MAGSQYEKLGVDAGKQAVRTAFGGVVENQFPGAFVNIVRDPSDLEVVEALHMDGDGSKIVQRFLILAETGDSSVLRGAADDALQMNLGDIAAAGFVFGRTLFADVINTNRTTVPKDILMRELGERFGELVEIYRSCGFDIHFMGGETADLPYQVKSSVLDVAVSSRGKERDIIKGNVQPGDKIWGFASDGQAAWEDRYNSGIMSNGLTLARIGLMWEGYTDKYPHLGRHGGRFKVGEKAGLPQDMAVSDAIISPTRQWAIIIKDFLQRLKDAGMYDVIHGISMNTGGGASKVGHVGRGITYVKHMPKPPEFFQLIQGETCENWKNMFESFNCGVGIDVVGVNNPQVEAILRQTAEETNIKLYELGQCETSDDGKNHVVAQTDYGTFNY